jgi:predicted phage terminase large subunit-like protein
LPPQLLALLTNPQAIDKELSRRSLNEYASFVLDMEPAAHHRLLNSKLEAVERGEISRLMVFMPPGHAKSTYASIAFPAWFIGKNPKKTIILSSYASTLAERFGRKIRDQITLPRWPFPDVKLNPTTKAKGEWETSLGGEFFAAGVGGGITGRRADAGIIDDPVKGRQDADSLTVRNSTWEWYLSDFRTRLKPGAAIIIIQTRWHEDDLSGRILPLDYAGESGWITSRDGEKWYVINLPAIAETNDLLGRNEGEALWPEWLSKEMLDQERLSQGNRNWIALYQQRPAPEDGDFYKREWFKWYDEAPANLRKYGASDYAVTADDGDYTVHAIAGVDEKDDLYILDVWRKQTTPDIWVEVLLDMAKQWQPAQWGEESGQIIKSLDPFITKRQRERKAFFYREQYTSAVDKATRSQSFRARMAMGKVFFPSYAPWMPTLMAEMLSFPAGKNDDQCDVMGLFGRILDQMQKTKPKKAVNNDILAKPTFNDVMKRHTNQNKTKSSTRI